MEGRFSRTELLIGERGLQILAGSRVAVFGLGGVGSHAAEALARAGVGNLVLVDFDRVSPSNINRQLHALTSAVGEPKALLMAERAKLINPDIRVEARVERYLPGLAEQFFNPAPDYVIDAIDDVPAKIDLIASCFQRDIPVVSSMGTGNKLDPTAFKVADISQTAVCPLARIVRRRLRQLGITSGVTVVFSTEPPRRCGSGGESPAVPGSISFVPPVAGFILAGLVVRGLLCCNGYTV